MPVDKDYTEGEELVVLAKVTIAEMKLVKVFTSKPNEHKKDAPDPRSQVQDIIRKIRSLRLKERCAAHRYLQARL